MDYELLLNEIINIGKEMIKSGAETNRVEDSMYRMLESYDIGQCSVFAIQSNIQVLYLQEPAVCCRDSGEV